MASVPQTYTISDFIEWYNKKQLILSPDFQRGSVWTPSAKVYLIDTILNDFPMPQIYFRTILDRISQTTVREVVDGQQRLRAILEFAAGKLKLTLKAPNHKGKFYADLNAEDQESFLSYKVSVVQLLNANDADVLEVFARLNSYSVKVTPAELRHAEYSEPVKWAIYDATSDWSKLWNEFKIVSVRESVRLKNTSVMAEMFMVVDVGFGDGGEPSIGRYYREHIGNDETYFQKLRVKIDETINEIIKHTSQDFVETTFYDAPNFLALFAAAAYLNGNAPDNRLTEGITELRGVGVDWESAGNSLAQIAQAFDLEDDESSPYAQFVGASKSTTHRVSSRKTRLHFLVNAIANHGAK
ncbi:hypothetical protein GCM10010909_11200 [Acidocella aquatica]|uniref:GmrSD restriction endonucleases N-terminal domain-containing protein n=1 Tax=Acidocella aquatica TaxID=1922313 RepID=A0ABQ6A8P0_9PROT|nr:DUF262 domain-containing protein [Acidocella aquatica]GLR66440.1 hypothetical protein GCM10010909_11200 [Acidocella aquatica]